MELINVKDLSFAYANSNRDILRDVNLQLNSGQIVLLAGQSGCGKTTLLRQLKPSITPAGYRKGHIFFQGQDVEDMSTRDDAALIAYVGQNPNTQIVTDTVRSELAFGLENLGLSPDYISCRIAELAIYFGLDKFLDRKTHDLSGGEKQLLNLASAMSMNPRLLILDEPCAQLDPMSARKFIDMICRINSELGVAVIICEHHLQDIYPIVDTVILMEEGRIVESAPPRDGIANEYIKIGLPAALRIAKELGAVDNLPLTVADGIDYVDSYIEKKSSKANSGPSRDEYSNQRKEAKLAIRVDNISMRYSKSSRDILSRASLAIREKSITSIVGGNGAGKTTLLKVLSGILPVYEGSIYIGDKRCRKPSDFPRGEGAIAYLPQDPRCLITGISVADELHNTTITEQMGLRGLEDMHPYDLSGGQIQRLALGKLLEAKPSILLLDEPSKGLDPKTKSMLGELLVDLSEDITIVIVSHDLEFVAEYSSDLAMCFDGRITAVKDSHQFFAENSFYTTSANRIVKKHYPNAITTSEAIGCLEGGL